VTSVWWRCHNLTTIRYSSATVRLRHNGTALSTRSVGPRSQARAPPVRSRSFWSRYGGGTPPLGPRSTVARVAPYPSPISSRDVPSSVDPPTRRCGYPGMAPRPDGVRLPTRIEKPCLDVQAPFSGASSEANPYALTPDQAVSPVGPIEKSWMTTCHAPSRPSGWKRRWLAAS